MVEESGRLEGGDEQKNEKVERVYGAIQMSNVF